MIRFCPKDQGVPESKGSEKDEPLTLPPQPKTPEVDEEENSISQQKIFEEFHEKLVYDTIEEKLSNFL